MHPQKLTRLPRIMAARERAQILASLEQLMGDVAKYDKLYQGL